VLQSQSMPKFVSYGAFPIGRSSFVETFKIHRRLAWLDEARIPALCPGLPTSIPPRDFETRFGCRPHSPCLWVTTCAAGQCRRRVQSQILRSHIWSTRMRPRLFSRAARDCRRRMRQLAFSLVSIFCLPE
jgi:hypothetical protein